MVPSSRPRIEKEAIDKLLKNRKLLLEFHPVILIGVRGYYSGMGEQGTNDRGLYDDAAIWVTSSKIECFNFNTDPKGYRYGDGTGERKGMACLQPGLYDYKKGPHKAKAAFRQAGKVTVMRDGVSGNYLARGFFGINIHGGAVDSTASLGCQTVPPEQWPEFKALGYMLITNYGLKTFKYLLVSHREIEKTEKYEVPEYLKRSDFDMTETDGPLPESVVNDVLENVDDSQD